MQLRSIVLTATILAAGVRAGAQDLRIEVVEASTGKPIVGANVVLLDSSALISLGGGFSDQRGRTELRAPARGPYRVRADKVGYDTWTSVQLHLGDKAVYVRAGMAPTRIPAPIMPRSEVACQQLGGPGTPAGDLWVELKKALTANAMTEAQGLVPLDVDLYERVLDRNLSILSERADQRTRVSRRPATGISWDQIDSARRGQVSNNDVYRAPDAATMLSDQFVRSHCYSAIRGYGAENGLTGLEFKPARVGAQPELTGVLWLDPQAKALRSLSFDYVNLPVPLRIARTSGRVEFQQLAGGQWIVPRWYIRMPRVTRVTSANVSSDSLVGYQEVGGAARPAGTAPVSTGAATASAPTSGAAPSPATPAAVDSPSAANQSTITGVVFDSTTGRPLRGVEVSIRGGRSKTLTSPGGGYQLAVDGALNDTIVFEHPRLRLFRVADRIQTISLPVGARAQASVIIPSYESLRKNLCGQNETRLVATKQQRTVETDSNSDGSYVMCGFTRNAQITARVGIAGRNTVEEKIAFPSNMVSEHDFLIGAR